ncbi:hypothetical protein KKD62_03840 [Patescibacteria group bacterium]|nr:hypothetical protein [Patescibacteria group bacterium]MBU1931138.1 hypothetical protein [Patescibacteria group bacterium]
MTQTNKKTIDFRPLSRVGFSKKLLESLIFLFLPQIQQDLMVKMHQAFTEEEKEDLYARGKKYAVGSEEAGQFLKEEFFKKTGQSLEDQSLERLQQYLDMIRTIMEKSAESLSLVGQMSQADVAKLKQLLDNNQFEKVNQLLAEYQDKKS